MGCIFAEPMIGKRTSSNTHGFQKRSFLSPEGLHGYRTMNGAVRATPEESTNHNGNSTKAIIVACSTMQVKLFIILLPSSASHRRVLIIAQ
jgi:hypothetical protein